MKSIQVDKLGILLSKTALEFESEGVLNPAVIQSGDDIHLFYRAVAPGNNSTIGYCKLSAPDLVKWRSEVPLLSPEFAYESQGLEDPRIVCIENTFYMTYTAYDGINALGALAISTDLINWQKKGIIVPQITYEEFRKTASVQGELQAKYQRFNESFKSHEPKDYKQFIWDKNFIFFPRKIDGKFCFLHRIKPEIQIVVAIDKLEDLNEAFWCNYFLSFQKFVVLSPRFEHEVSYVGSGCPPIETTEGWLILYHGVHDTINGYVYSACAALLDINNPQIEIARLPYPLFYPERAWELKGEVNNVCFPTGALVIDDTLFIYYGAADERIAVASLSVSELLEALISHGHDQPSHRSLI